MTERYIHITEDLRVLLHPEHVFTAERDRIIRSAIGLGLAPYLRGKKLDKLLSPLSVDPGDAARRRLFMQERYVPVMDDNVPILPDRELPEPDLMEDIKVTGGPAHLQRLGRVLAYGKSRTLAEIDEKKPAYLAYTKDAAKAWEAFRPKERTTVQYTTIPEPPHIPYIRLDHTADFFGLPPVAVIRSPKDLAAGRPFQMMPAHYRSVSVTARQSGEPKKPDLREEKYATNLDTLMAPFEAAGDSIILRLPTLPAVAVFPEESARFWNRQLDTNNPFAPYALLDIFSRAARKAAFHAKPWEQRSLHDMEHIAQKASAAWQRIPLNTLEQHKLRWEWEAANDMAPEATMALFLQLAMPAWIRPKAMHLKHAPSL